MGQNNFDRAPMCVLVDQTLATGTHLSNQDVAQEPIYYVVDAAEASDWNA